MKYLKAFLAFFVFLPTLIVIAPIGFMCFIIKGAFNAGWRFGDTITDRIQKRPF